MEIRILGPIEVNAHDGVPLQLGGLRERALLALFALSPRQTISTDRLIDDLWGEELPANPSNALQALVSRLRRVLGSGAIVTRSPGYVLDVPPEAVDASRFRALVAAAEAVDDAAVRRERLREALALWRGPALAEFPFEEFALRESSALNELRLSATEGRIAAALESGAGADLVPELEELVREHPLRESLRASQMLALYRSGRQADALRAYSAARDTLGEELGIEPGPQLRALEESILMQDPHLDAPAVNGVPGVRSELPARLASFVGREAELVELEAAFATSRLVTVTGAGGAGKTSLAIEVGRRLAAEYQDGVWLIDLAPVVDPGVVPDALVRALHLEQVLGLGAGLDKEAVAYVVEFLKERRALLLLDNCEQVIEAAAAVAEAILLACPSVEILATSRDRLGIPGELLWRTPPLEISGRSSDAIRLFTDRAQAVNPSFSPDELELELIASICRKVDGMPLAIELAAARVRSLPVEEIARRLDTDLGVLRGASRGGAHRQRTLRTTIDWSYTLLTDKEAKLFALLSVFHGSFSLEAVEAIAPSAHLPATEVLDTLERLIDSSMVAPISLGDSGRYRLLETLRMYAAEKLAADSDVDGAMRRLLDYFLLAVAPAQDALRGPDQLLWLDRIEADHDTIRGVLDWVAVHAPSDGLRLAGMLGWFWFLRGSGDEGRRRFAELLEASGPDASARSRGDAHFLHSLMSPTPENAQAGFAAARRAYLEVDFSPGVANADAMIAAWGFDADATNELLASAAELATDSGYEWGVALIRFLQAGVASLAKDNEAAIRLAREATSRFAALGDRWGQGYSLYSAGVALRALGRYDEAEDALRTSLENARPMRLRREMAPVMSELASIAMMRDDFVSAERWLADAQRFADEVPFAGSQGMVRNARGRLARLRGDPAEALRLHQQAIELYERADSGGGLAYSHSCAGFAQEMIGDLAAARTHHLAALDHAQQPKDVFAVALALEGLGATLIASGEVVRGVELLGAGLAAREEAGAPLPPGEHFDADRALESAGPNISDALEVGHRLGLERALALAAEI
ncbi:MAG: hypothetical protein GY720_06430 [bacterium]|nr:hypothetical protein [bacterium]